MLSGSVDGVLRRFIIFIVLLIYLRNTWYQGMLEWNSQLTQREEKELTVNEEQDVDHPYSNCDHCNDLLFVPDRNTSSSCFTSLYDIKV
jgi:hypothetical protein